LFTEGLKDLQPQLHATSNKIIQLLGQLMDARQTRQRLTGLLLDASDSESGIQIQLKEEIEKSKKLRERIQVAKQSQEDYSNINNESNNLLCVEVTDSNTVDVQKFLEQFNGDKMTEEETVISGKSNSMEENTEPISLEELAPPRVVSKKRNFKKHKLSTPITTFVPIRPAPVKSESTYVLNVIGDSSSTMLLINPLIDSTTLVFPNGNDCNVSATESFAILPESKHAAVKS